MGYFHADQFICIKVQLTVRLAKMRKNIIHCWQERMEKVASSLAGGCADAWQHHQKSEGEHALSPPSRNSFQSYDEESIQR